MTSNLPALPPDIAEELLRAQAASIPTPQNLPRIKILPQGINLFEFEDSHETTGTFEGIILHGHPTNVLWEKKFGTGSSDEPNFPACSSDDGITGVPRDGFRHATLEREASKTDRISCDTCRYNQWESASLIGKEGRGKACSNQRALYVQISGRTTPMTLNLSPTSGPALDEYLSALIASRIPAQALITTFSLERKQKGTNKWSQLVLTRGRFLNPSEFSNVLRMRSDFAMILGVRPMTAEAQTHADAEDVEQMGETDTPPF